MNKTYSAEEVIYAKGNASSGTITSQTQITSGHVRVQWDT